MTPPIPITQIKIQYVGEQKEITAAQLKGAFSAYVVQHLKESLEKKRITPDIIYNRDAAGKPIQRYPLVQFGTLDNTFEIVGIGKGDVITTQWLKRVLKETDFTINGKEVDLLYPEKTTQFWYPGLLPQPRLYRITEWKPFDAETLGNEFRLNGILWGNLHRIFDDLGIRFNEKVNIRLQKITKRKPAKGYKIEWINYDAVFSTNVNLPQHIGIGHEPSIGSGKIEKLT